MLTQKTTRSEKIRPGPCRHSMPGLLLPCPPAPSPAKRPSRANWLCFPRHQRPASSTGCMAARASIRSRSEFHVFGSERQTAKMCVCGLMLRRRGNLCFSRKNAIFGALAASDRQDLGGLMAVWIFRSKTRFRHPPPRRAKGKIGLGNYLKTPWRHVEAISHPMDRDCFVAALLAMTFRVLR
jgi:hypothetical protein